MDSLQSDRDIPAVRVAGFFALGGKIVEQRFEFQGVSGTGYKITNPHEWCESPSMIGDFAYDVQKRALVSQQSTGGET